MGTLAVAWGTVNTDVKACSVSDTSALHPSIFAFSATH
jgi:hypothetical protein